jgi:Ca2+-binding RTX toxin-like protein
VTTIKLNRPIDFGSLEIIGSGISDTTASGFTVSSGANKALWSGSGLSYVLGLPVAGTLTSVKLYAGSTLLGTVSGISVEVDSLMARLASGMSTSASVIFGGRDLVTGSRHGDELHMHAGNDVVLGNNGNDRLYGGIGNDLLWGGNHNDQLHGQDGKDLLAGGRGRDVMTGGLGADRFDYDSLADSRRGSERDTIIDFHHAERDRIDLRGVDADLRLAGDQAFHFIGERAFTGQAGELRCNNGFVQADVNGDRVADLEIRVLGLDSLEQADFLL